MKILQKKLDEARNVLLSSTKAPKQEMDINTERDILSESFIRRTLLSTRLTDLKLNKTRVDESTISGAGRGLFARTFISKGEVITCYPGDALLCSEMTLDSDSDFFDANEFGDSIIWGSHVHAEDRLDDDLVLYDDSIEGFCSDSLLAQYVLEVCDEFSIIGMPSLDSDPAYYGHFANDGAGFFARKSMLPGVNIEDEIAAYVSESIEISNAKHESIDGLHMVTIATQDIKEGEEIFVTYGFDYWIEHSF